jgi:prolyl oligopeptidase
MMMMSLVVTAASAGTIPGQPKPDYPQTRSDGIIETQFGEAVADPYRWLENDVRNDAEVRAWVVEQNKLTASYLETLPGREIFASRLKALFNFQRMGTPRKAGENYFYTRNDGLQNQSVLMVQQGTSGTPKLLIDPNAWAKDGATALAEWQPSPNGRYLAYAVQDGGTDWRTLRVIDAETGASLEDDIKWVKFSNIAWTKDNAGFFYSRFAEPQKGAAFQSLNTNQQVWYHKVGTKQAEDRLIYKSPDRPLLGHSAEVTDDGRYILITSSGGTDERYELTVGSLGAKQGVSKSVRFKTLIGGLDYEWQLAGSVGPTFYFRTNRA